MGINTFDAKRRPPLLGSELLLLFEDNALVGGNTRSNGITTAYGFVISCCVARHDENNGVVTILCWASTLSSEYCDFTLIRKLRLDVFTSRPVDLEIWRVCFRIQTCCCRIIFFGLRERRHSIRDHHHTVKQPRALTRLPPTFMVYQLTSTSHSTTMASAPEKPPLFEKTFVLQLLNDLPVELTCKVLSYLPAKEIQCARGLCRLMKKTIDDPGNQTMLLKPGMEASRARIQKAHDTLYIFAKGELTLMNVLDRFVSHYGVPQTGNSRTLSRIAIRIYLTWLNESRHQGSQLNQWEIPCAKPVRLVQALLETHLHYHTKVAPVAWCLEPDPTNSLFLNRHFDAASCAMVGITADEAVGWYNEVNDGRLSHARSVNVFRDESCQLLRALWEGKLGAWDPSGKQIECRNPIVQQLVRISRAAKYQGFCYFVKSGQVLKMVNQLRAGAALTPLQSAAVLEEMNLG